MSSLRASPGEHVSVCVLAAILVIALGETAASSKENVLYAFRGGNDGAVPYSSLISVGAGNLYGTSSAGGGGACQFGGCGTVFKLAPDRTETVLHAFIGSDGAYPVAGLVSDSNGNLYGTTSEGGTDNYGIVFMVAPNGVEKSLYSFQDGNDGAGPQGDLLLDLDGNLYGTAVAGGFRGSDCSSYGCGVVFELTAAGNETARYAFQGGTDGWNPVGSLIADSGGNLYGVTLLGGADCLGDNVGCGTVFKIAPDGTETQVHVFQGGSDGRAPSAGVIVDAAGNLYGTTSGGGSGTSCTAGCGTIYKVTAAGAETVLYSFQGGSDGSGPESSLIMDKRGNLLGTTYFGGSTACGGGGCGTVFELTANGAETVLYAFRSKRGRYPTAALLRGAHGKLYGTTSEGGENNNGVVFELKK